MSTVSINNISLIRGTKTIFDNFSLNIDKNKTTAIIASSGAGKTTLLDIICKRLSVENGSIYSDSDKISYVFQEDRLLSWHTVKKNIALPLEKIHIPLEEKNARVKKYISLCALDDKIYEKPNNLSGGEKQRVSIARAFAYPSNLLLMDEAFQSLDLHIKFQLLELFDSLIQTERRTSILVTHDIREALSIADRIIVLKGSPLNIELDVEITQSKTETIRNKYIHLSKENISLQEKILNILSQSNS